MPSYWKTADWPSFESRSKEKDTRTLGSALSVVSSLSVVLSLSLCKASMGLETFSKTCLELSEPLARQLEAQGHDSYLEDGTESRFCADTWR